MESRYQFVFLLFVGDPHESISYDLEILQMITFRQLLY
jgi:hypothetical protein